MSPPQGSPDRHDRELKPEPAEEAAHSHVKFVDIWADGSDLTLAEIHVEWANDRPSLTHIAVAQAQERSTRPGTTGHLGRTPEVL